MRSAAPPLPRRSICALQYNTGRSQYHNSLSPARALAPRGKPASLTLWRTGSRIRRLRRSADLAKLFQRRPSSGKVTFGKFLPVAKNFAVCRNLRVESADHKQQPPPVHGQAQRMQIPPTPAAHPLREACRQPSKTASPVGAGEGEHPKCPPCPTRRRPRASGNRRHQGAVAKRPKAADCKSAIPGSNPGGAS